MIRVTTEELDELRNAETDDYEGEVLPAVKSPRAIVSVAFSRSDFERVARFARSHGMKTSEFIRTAALEQTKPKTVDATSIRVDAVRRLRLVNDFDAQSPIRRRLRLVGKP